MNKLLILYTTISQKTTNSTNYYQLTNCYVDKTKLLFLHPTTTIWYITFHYSTLHIFQNYYYLLMKLPFWKQKRTIGSYTNKKVLLSRDSPCFFPAVLLFDETLFLQIARTARHGFHVRNHSTVLFAVWRVLYQGCGMFYTQFVNCNT